MRFMCHKVIIKLIKAIVSRALVKKIGQRQFISILEKIFKLFIGVGWATLWMKYIC